MIPGFLSDNRALCTLLLSHPLISQTPVCVRPVQKFQHELSTKWVLITVSTGTHVLLGKILQNHMLDLRIRNSKLFWRALAMLQVGGDGT